MKFQHPTGMHDILPEDVPTWLWLENTFRAVCARAGFEEIRTPVMEATELFARTAGESSDVVVTKQMYSFVAPDGENYTLRPEGTAGVARAFLEHHLEAKRPVTKLFYICPVFRYERTQAGRLRQHHQCGVEMLGASGPEADAEILALSSEFLKALGITATLKINSLGTNESRKSYIEKLRAHLEPQRANLSADSQRRLDVNPLRVFDSKEERDHLALEGAPRLLDHLQESDAESSSHFARVCEILDDLGITYEIDHNLVRGFDYYSRTAFEWVSDKLGAQSTVLGGGRYDGLVEELGGQPTPGIGFGSGIERLLLVRAATEGIEQIENPRLTAFLVALGDNAKRAAPRLVAQVRSSGVSCDYDLAGRSMRQQMREANRQKARFALVIGDDELANGTVALKNLDTSEQTTLSLEEACQKLQLS